jgi:hypothetical protein
VTEVLRVKETFYLNTQALCYQDAPLDRGCDFILGLDDFFPLNFDEQSFWCSSVILSTALMSPSRGILS